MANIHVNYRTPTVPNFYNKKSVLITGGTGYLGKALIEKLLYSCNGIEHIYVLLRDKKGEGANERVAQITDSYAFERLKSRSPDELKKIIPVSGNVTKKGLGISNEDLQLLEQNVSIVFHLAATVDFNEPLKYSVDINVTGTQELIKLCHRMQHLKAFIHVSTAFSNADRRKIDEVVYRNAVDLQQVKCIAEAYSEDECVVKNLLGNKPNTYTFTKALAEEVVANEIGDIPSAIIRPSIVISALKEPSPGWIDNWNGATGLFVGMSSGVMKVMVGRGSNITDLVPLDIVVNLIIVAATKCESSSLKVYNCCTGTSNPITCNEAEAISRKITQKHSINQLPFPFMVFTSSEILYNLLRFFLQLIPSYLIDLWSILSDRKAVQMKIQHRINKIVELMKFFLLYEWYFEDKNVRSLLKSISEADKDVFNFDVTSINWEQCLEDYILGAKKHLVK